MPQDPLNPKKHRNLRPSRATLVGGSSAAALAPALVAILGAAGVTVTAELAAALGPVLAFVFAWLTRGGRKGESE